MADDMMPEMGAPPVDPMAMMLPPAPPAGPEVLPLSDEARGQWKTEIKKSRDERKAHETWWDAAVKNYGPKPDDQCDTGKMTARTQSVMVIVEVKNATLFHKRGDISVSPSPLLAGPHEALCKIHADILNEKLGVDGVDSRDVMQQSIFDYEMFGGGYSLIVYEAFTRPHPVTGVPVPLAKKCSWVNLSPKQTLIPAGLKTPDLDKHAPWVGHEWDMPLAQAKRLWSAQIPEDFKGSGRTDDTHIKTGSAQEEHGTKRVTGSTIWYRSNLYRPEIAHPDHFTKLVLIDGIDEPVEHRDDPDQTLDDMGALTPDSRVGYPICALQIRKMTDSSRVMSDVAMAMPLSTELDIYREQQIRLRAIQLIRFAYNAGKMTKEALQGFFQDVMGGMIPFTDEMMQNFDQTFRQIDPGTYSQDNYRGAADIKADLDKLFGIDNNAAGLVSPGSGTTATESNNAAGARGVRMSYEQGIVNDFYIKSVTKLSTVLQRYLGPEDVARIVGHEKAQMWAGWSKAMPTRLSFTLMPDSTLWNDSAVEGKRTLDQYSQLRNDPNVDALALLKGLAPKWHLDPAIFRAPQPPQPEPIEKPKASVTFKMEDFVGPQGPVTADIFQQISGIKLDPSAFVQSMIAGHDQAQQEAAQEAQKAGGGFQEHPGAVQPVDTLDKHQADLTGGMNGTGVPSPNMSPNLGQPM